ncbi:importin-beta N-terminal domain-containing protein [Cryptosporidium andersoni]|uniref:Importin-beta N-terminal domain-containing protein n=1 Tax=Cryptosporidium andersoni TaxID=117008 RepID=A0A1J4MSS5_9CRYT|nr:importin-beta N-terminal domain-containing protein [Cryptosporidium andersoni]
MLPEIVSLLNSSISTNPIEVRTAEASLTSKEAQDGFIETLILIISKGDIDISIRQIACIYLKNNIKKRWDIDCMHGGVKQNDRNFIKENIIKMYINTPNIVQTQVAEILLYISVRDFPSYWPELLSDIIKCFPGDEYLNESLLNNYDKLNLYSCTLTMTKLVLDKYRCAESSNKILTELRDILQIICIPLYKVFIFSSQALLSGVVIHEPNNTAILNICLLCCQIFYSLHCCDVPEFFENNIQVFMHTFHSLLELQHKDDGSESLFLTFNIKSQICENLRIYSDRYQEPFDPYSRKSLSTIGILLTNIIANQYLYENGEISTYCSTLIDEGLRLIGSLASTQWSDNPFVDKGILEHLIENILIPCTFMSISDLSSIEETPKEFIYKYLWDINEICDSTSKRSAALGCIRSLGKFYNSQLSALLTCHIVKLLENVTDSETIFEWTEFSRNTSQPVKYKINKSEIIREGAIFLFICLSVHSFSRSSGVTQLQQDVDLVGFYDQYIKRFSTTSLLRCCSLKYLIVFRNHFPPGVSISLLEEASQWISVSSFIVRMMVLLAFEKLFSQRNLNLSSNTDINSNSTSTHRITGNQASSLCLQFLSDVLKPMLEETLYNSSNSTCLMTDSEFVPRCIVRLLSYLGLEGKSFISSIIPAVSAHLKLVTENSKNPIFNHFLYELLGICIRNTTNYERNAMDPVFLPILIDILQQHKTEFMAYSLQILALRLDTLEIKNEFYTNLFVHLLDEPIWRSSVSILPGIVRLLCSYLRKSSLFGELVPSNLKQIFNRFQFCLSHRRFQSNIAFDLLRDTLRYLPYESYSNYLPTLITLLLTKCQEWNRADEIILITQIVGVMFLIIIERPQTSNLPTLIILLENIQSGLSSLFFNKIVFPNINKAVLTPPLRFLCIAGITKLVSENSNTITEELIFESFKSITVLLGGLINDNNSIERRKGDSTLDNLESLWDQTNYAQDEYEVNYHKLVTASINYTDIYPNGREIAKKFHQNFQQLVILEDSRNMIKITFSPFLNKLWDYYQNDPTILELITHIK